MSLDELKQVFPALKNNLPLAKGFNKAIGKHLGLALTSSEYKEIVVVMCAYAQTGEYMRSLDSTPLRYDLFGNIVSESVPIKNKKTSTPIYSLQVPFALNIFRSDNGEIVLEVDRHNTLTSVHAKDELIKLSAYFQQLSDEVKSKCNLFEDSLPPSSLDNNKILLKKSAKANRVQAIR